MFYFLFSFFHHLLLFLSSKKRLMFVYVHRKSLSRTKFPVALCITYHDSLLRSNGAAACSQRKYFGTFGVTHHSLTPHGSRGFLPHTVYLENMLEMRQPPFMVLTNWSAITPKTIIIFPSTPREIFHALWALRLHLMSFRSHYRRTSEPTSTNYCMCSSDKRLQVRPLILGTV